MYRGKRKTHKFLVALNNVSQRKRETETEGETKKGSLVDSQLKKAKGKRKITALQGC